MSQNKERLTTPAGIAKYPRLNTPDTKFKKEGQFKVTLVLDESDDAEFLDSLRELENTAVKEAHKNPKNKKLKISSAIRPHTDKDGNEVEGKVEVTFKTTASGQREDGSKWNRTIRMFTAKGRPTEANVGSGSKIKVAFTYDFYATAMAGIGLSLYLEAVQIIDLVEFKSEAEAGDFGFGEEEGSFEGDGSAFEETPEDGDAPMTEEEHDQAAEEEEQEPAKPAPKKPAPKPATKPTAPAKKAMRPRGDF